MSRIGKLPIKVAPEVEVRISDQNEVSLKSKGVELMVKVNPAVQVNFKEGKITLTRKSQEPQVRAWHGLYRALIYNAVQGVSEGWKKTLLYKGVGYKMQVSGKFLEMNLGFSRPVKMEIPNGLEVKTGKNNLVISGADKAKVGQFSAQIRSLRPPEPYLGKGIRYDDEEVRKKAGKSGGGGEKK